MVWYWNFKFVWYTKLGTVDLYIYDYSNLIFIES